MTQQSQHLTLVGRRVAGTVLLLVIALGIGVASTCSAQAQVYKESVLHHFAGTPDGAHPLGGVIFDNNGNLYGTTELGGASSNGTVYKLDNARQETVMYSFAGAPDGSKPRAGVIIDAAGNFYGTTEKGGPNDSGYGGAGTVYELNNNGQETVLFGFDAWDNPYAPLIIDAAGHLYGTTYYGGNGEGAVFETDTSGNETVLYNFKNEVDGANPHAPLIVDATGNLYGTTQLGGFAARKGLGTVFEVDSSGNETTLHSFAGAPRDGKYPIAGLVSDADGNLYGTTSLGGASDNGTVFKLNKQGHETVLHSFTGGADGGSPYAPLTIDAKGNLYGTTQFGGTFGYGVVYEVSNKGKEIVLYSFSGGPDGANPDCAGVIMDQNGNLYGTTRYGGTSGNGVVFELSK